MPEYRYERKYIINSPFEKDIVTVLKAHPYLFKEIFYKRTVNSLYFDNPANENFYFGVLGVPQRAKARIRWYNNDIEKCSLEIKVKSGSVGKKQIYELSKFYFEGNLRKNFLHSLNQSSIPDSLNIELKNLFPVTVNSFDRRYFMTWDKKFRATIDYNLKFKKLLSSNYKEIKFTHKNFLILEIKYNVEDDWNFTNITQSLPFRISKFSKYNMGVASI